METENLNCIRIFYKNIRVNKKKKASRCTNTDLKIFRIFTIINVELSGYYFYMNLNILGDFQICVSVPLS